MKRILSWMLTLALMLSLSACSGKQAEPENPTQPNTQTESEGKQEVPVPPDGPEMPQTPLEDNPDHSLVVLSGSDSLSEWSDGTPLCRSDWQTLALSPESAQRFPALATALGELNLETQKWSMNFVVDNLPYARELFEEGDEYFYGLTHTDTYTVQRADEIILSIRGDQGDYTGGVHPNYGVYGINLDPETGEVVNLSDVLTTTDTLNGILEEKLRAKYPDEPFPSLTEMLADYEPDAYTWTMNYQGVTVYFSPYEIASYAAGLLSVTLWFDEAPELFRDRYLHAPQQGYAMALPVGYPVEFDLDGTDAVRDEILISFLADEYDMFRPMLTLNDMQLYDEEQYSYEMWPYLVQVEGKHYIYLECMIENDYRILSVYDLNADEIRLVDRVYGSGFHTLWFEEGAYGVGRTEVFTNPGGFVLDTRLDMLGTMTGTKEYHVDPDSGMPVEDSCFFELPGDRAPLTTLVSLEVEIVPEFEPETLPEGTSLWFLRTDGHSYVDMRMEDGRECRITVEAGPEGWERYVNGMPETDCFDGLLYAG